MLKSQLLASFSIAMAVGAFAQSPATGADCSGPERTGCESHTCIAGLRLRRELEQSSSRDGPDS